MLHCTVCVQCQLCGTGHTFLQVFTSTVWLHCLFGVAPASTVLVGALVCGLVSELLTQEGLILLMLQFVMLVWASVVPDLLYSQAVSTDAPVVLTWVQQGVLLTAAVAPQS